jgi:hypothetical protein
MTSFAQLLDRPLSTRARWAVTLAAGALGALAGFTGIREFDQWFHMAWGRAWVDGGFPAHDPFLFTFLDKPALGNGEWLGSVGIYLSWLVGGDAGTILLVGLMLGATAAVMVWDGMGGEDAPRWTDAAVAVVAAALAVGMIRHRAVGRPEIFCYPALAWTLFAARRWAEGRGRALLAFPVVALVWANTHPTILYGLGAVFLFAAETWARGRLAGADGGPLRERGLRLALLGAAGTAASFVHFGGGSPVLPGVRYALDMLGIRAGPTVDPQTQASMDLMHKIIIELQPPELQYYFSAAGALIALAGVGFLVAWRKGRPAEFVLAAVGLTFAVRAGRFMPLFAVLVAASTSRNLRAGLARIPERFRAVRWGVLPAVPAAMAATALLMPLPFSFGQAEEIYPSYVADVLVRAGAPKIPGVRIYNTFHYGGYLEWRLGAPVLYNDGRLVWPPGEAQIAMTAGGWRDVATLDEHWDFDALVLENLRFGSPEVRRSVQGLGYDLMADRDRYALVAIDDAAQLYVRRDGRLAHLLGSEYRVVSPSRIPTKADLDDPFFVTRYRAEMARAVAENPSCVYCRVGLYLGHLAAGDPDAAEALFPQGELPRTKHPLGNGSLDILFDGLVVLGRLRASDAGAAQASGKEADAERLYRVAALASETAFARNKLGVLRAGQGDYASAEREFRRAIELDDRFLEPRLHLATLLATTGRYDGAREIFNALQQYAPGTPEARAARTRLESMEQRLRSGP